MPTETSAGSTLVYIANHLSCKCHNDLNIYKKWTGIYFYWNCQPKDIKHYCGSPSMDLTDFNYNYLNKLLENISKKQKSIFQLEVLMLTSWIIMSTNEFSDSLASNSFIALLYNQPE